MSFKNVQEMKSKAYHDKWNNLTKDETEWLEDLKTRINNKLENAYENNPGSGLVYVYSKSIPYSALKNGGSDAFFRKIEDIRDDLRYTGYYTSLTFEYDRLTKLADHCIIDIRWK